MKLTPLSYALIGLAIAEPRSGYALRKVFETTPLGSYSSSPGSIYPALAKLVALDLLKKSSTLDSNKMQFEATSTGRAILKNWLIQSVSLDTVASEVEIALLQFAFLETLDDPIITYAFLVSFEQAVSQHLKNLYTFTQSADGQKLSTHGRLAMENGIAGYEGHLTWVKHALPMFATPTK